MFSQGAISRSADMLNQMRTGTTVNRILLADGAQLHGDCGEQGTIGASNIGNHCAITASQAVPPRVFAHGDIGHGENGPYPSRNYISRYNAPSVCSAPALSTVRRPYSANTGYLPPRSITQYEQFSMERGVGYAAPAAMYSIEPTPAQIFAQTGSHRAGVCPSPFIGTSQLASSVPSVPMGPGHRGPLPQYAARQPAHRYHTDLSGFIPGSSPVQTEILNPADGDRYHRTSVLAASGVPMDLPTHSGVNTWDARIVQDRT